MSILRSVPIGSAYTSEFNKNTLCVERGPNGYHVTKAYPPGSRMGKAEIHAYQLLTRRGVEEVPKILEVDPAGQWMRMEYIDGNHMQLSSINNPNLERLGRLLKRCHDQCKMSDHPAAIVRRWARSTFFLCASGIIRTKTAQLLSACIATQGPELFSRQAPTLVHRDLRSANILSCATGEIRILDWETATVGHPGQDIERVLWRELRDDPEATYALLHGYTGAGSSAVPWLSHQRLLRSVFAIEMLEYLTLTNQVLSNQVIWAELRDYLSVQQ